jgi:hypothetical protein
VKVPYWIQQADLSATDYDPVDVEAALQIVRSHDWSGELTLQKEREAAGQETCPPGIGFVCGGRILHICPASDGTALVHYDAELPRVELRVVPQLIRFGVVLVAGVAAWRLLQHGDLLRSSLGIAAGIFGIYVLHEMSRQIGTSSVHLESMQLWHPSVPLASIHEYIRRFYADDYEWLSAHLQGSTRRGSTA